MLLNPMRPRCRDRCRDPENHRTGFSGHTLKKIQRKNPFLLERSKKGEAGVSRLPLIFNQQS